MPSFLSPAFLAGLLAVAIPILVHLRMRERRTSQPFPSLMFVRRIPHKSFRRRTLQNLVLFAARSLALVLLCLAFARPFFPVKAGADGALAGPLARVIALDVSASMQYQGVFPRAMAEAERAIRELKPSDSVGLLLFSDEVQGVVPPSSDHDKALLALRRAGPGAHSTRYAPALQLAGEWLSASKTTRREVVLITDGQARALAGAADAGLPGGVTVAVRSVADKTPENATVAEVTVESLKEAERSLAIVTARLVHQGPEPRAIKVTLEVAGRSVETKTVALPASGAVNVTFGRAPLPAGVSKGRILLQPDALAADDSFAFLLGAGGELRVLLVDSSPYVARALEIGDQPAFDVLRRTSLVASDLAGRSLVVLGDLPQGALGAAASSALARFVREGGGLLATSPPAGLRGDAAALLPGSWGENVSRLADRGASLGFVDLDHPALFVFKQARGFDFSRARFLQYRRFKAEADLKDGSLKVLARFDDGREALLEASVGSGRVLAFASPLDGLMSDLPVQPLFLPLVHELARYASAHQDAPLYHRVGGAFDLGDGRDAAPAGRPATVISPSGRRQTLEASVLGLELDEAGFYEASRGSAPPRAIAVNIDTSESDLTSLDLEELEAALRPTGPAEGPARSATPLEDGARQSWWRASLLAVILLMALESLLGAARGQKTAS
ncbi:MAG TPA: BatA and WFA domain-containing protein [Vicinamibacteria bacterium]|nr:BatA and WFA domain-containing protein [Vicinamibacteria bacterium]